MSLGHHKRFDVKNYRKGQLETCGIQHGVGPRAMGSRRKLNEAHRTHSIDTVDARRQVRQEKRRATKATRLHNKRLAKEAITDAT